MAQQSRTGEITYKNTATHISAIDKDPSTVIIGSTYQFTVDTPENEGLVSIQTNVHQLLSQIEAKNGLQHKYQVPGKDGIPKTEGALNEGDFLKVTDKYGKLLKVYHIKLKPFAVAGKLRLVKSEITINTKTDFNALFYCRPTKS